MKISELKQPYRRMAEYLAERNNKTNDLGNAFDWHIISYPFWNYVNLGKYPPITSEIKRKFPADFDFSEDAVKEIEIPFNFNIFNSMFKYEMKNNFYLDAKKHYTQLAKQGKFDQLPDTCEFSEAVELEVWDDELSRDFRKITGKFKGIYMDIHCIGWKNAQLPIKKIDFSEFRAGDVVEVELTHNEKRIGWFDYVNNNHLVINVLKRKGNQVCNGGNCAGSKMLNKEKIKSITKIK
jgi:hypothetical protein